jgi:hypothetical protein
LEEIMKKALIALGGIAVLAASAVAGGGIASAADHGDAPLAKANVPLDINDVYAFPGEDGNYVFAVTVNPLTMPGDEPVFDASGLYQIKVDNNGDAIADVSYNVDFGAADPEGVQTVTVRKATGNDATGINNAGSSVLTGDTEGEITDDGRMLFAGLRDDPFFFDLNAFRAGLAFRNPGNNFFKGTNISAIVLEVPESDFQAGGSTAAGVWAVTSKGGSVIDRMGRPAIATVFIPADQKDAFNQTQPKDDVATWKSTVVASLNGLGSDPALADALLPDILTFDTGDAAGFLNGRRLQDDVIDAELQLITGNMAASDNVANDSSFSGSFPYLGAPNTAPAPTPAPVTTAPAGAPTTGASAATPATGVTAPDTGTGDGAASGDDATMWIVLGVAVAVVVLGGGAFALRGRI